MRTSALTLAAAVVVAAGCGSSTEATVVPVSKILNFTAAMVPGGEPPGLVGNPTGSGTFTATLDTSTNLFTYKITYSGLTSTINNGHIHGPFVVGGTPTTGTVILNYNTLPGATFGGFGTGTSGTATGSVVLTAATTISATVNGDSLRKLILAGLTYSNIHTVSNPGGEIRAQIVRAP
jgi:hypothetical protein